MIAGAGHNSLLCAAYLAKAGASVLVLEGRTMIGGGVKTAEVLLPGFKEDLCSTVHGGINANPALVNREIDVFDYGYEIMDPEIVVHIPFASGACFTASAYGDSDLDGNIAVVSFFHADDAGVACPVTLFPAIGPPIDPSDGMPILEQPVDIYQWSGPLADDY